MDANANLFGASTLVPAEPPALDDRSLVAAAFLNVLRQDITYSLIHDCPLRVNIDATTLRIEHPRQDRLANAVTLLLAREISWHFQPTSGSVAEREITRGSLDQDLKAWRSSFKAKPFCDQVDQRTWFPRIQMLEDTQASALQYYHVARCIISEDETVRMTSAHQIVGLAMFSTSDPVMVHAYGAICFSGRWISDQNKGMQRKYLVDWLQSSQKRTGWSVEAMISRLGTTWASCLHDSLEAGTTSLT